MRYCKNNLTPGKICLSGFKQLPDDYFFCVWTQEMTDFCLACREAAGEVNQRYVVRDKPRYEAEPTTVRHMLFFFSKDDFEIGEPPKIGPERQRQIREWMLNLVEY